MWGVATSASPPHFLPLAICIATQCRLAALWQVAVATDLVARVAGGNRKAENATEKGETAEPHRQALPCRDVWRVKVQSCLWCNTVIPDYFVVLVHLLVVGRKSEKRAHVERKQKFFLGGGGGAR